MVIGAISAFVGSVASDLAAGMVGSVVAKGASKLWKSDDRQKALQASIEAGLTAAEATLPGYDNKGPEPFYFDQLRKFLKDPDVHQELTILLNPAKLAEDDVGQLTSRLRDQFTKITGGYTPEQIPDLDFDGFLTALFVGFATTAKEQPALQAGIQIDLLNTMAGQFAQHAVKQDEQLHLLEQMNSKLNELQALPATIDATEFAPLLEQIIAKQLTAAVEQLPAPSPQLPAPKIPVDLPPSTERFTGRATLVQQVMDAVQLNRVVTLWGPGGRGKTALAWRALSKLQEQGELAQRFADGVLFHSFYRRPNIADCLTYVAQSLGIDNVRDPVGACQRALSGKQVLLILDGAEDCEDLRQILELRGGCGVLITTRNQQQAPQPENVIAVNALERVDAYALIKSWAGELATDTVANAKALDAICDHVGDLALAVRLAAHTMAQNQMTAPDYWEWLQEEPIDALYIDDTSRSRNVDRLIHKTVAQVSDESQTILHLAANLAYLPFGWHVLSGTLPDWKRSDLNRAVRQLVDFGLLNRNEDGTLALAHALVYSYVRHAPLTNEKRAMLQELGGFYNDYARTESAKGLAGYETLDADRPHIMTVLQRLTKAELWDQTNKIAWAVAGGDSKYLGIRGYWADYITGLHQGVKASQMLSNQNDEASHLLHLEIAYRSIGRINDGIVYAERALAISRKIGSKRTEGNALGNLGLAYESLGRVEEAIDHLQQALTISRKIDNKKSVSRVLGNLGNSYMALNRAEEAMEYYQQALIIRREIGDRRGEGINLGNLGIAYEILGQMKEATENYKQALIISCEIGDRSSEARNLANMGLLQEKRGHFAEARQLWQQALTIFEQIKSPTAATVQQWLNDLPPA